MRPRAAFTIVQNEPLFLPLWLDYYSRHFDRRDLYVLDHDSTDGTTEAVESRCTVVRVHRDRSFDHGWLNATVTRFQAFLLQSYKRVLFTECDEFVVADPARYGGLADYISQCRAPLVRCTGFEVVHYPDEEPPLRLGEPLLAQRRYWHASRSYSKALLAAEPVSWSLGFHEATSHGVLHPDPALLLVHLHRIDYAACVEKHRQTAARRWNERDLEGDLGIQNRLVEEDPAFRQWYFLPDRLPIPDRVRDVL